MHTKNLKIELQFPTTSNENGNPLSVLNFKKTVPVIDMQHALDIKKDIHAAVDISIGQVFMYEEITRNFL